MVKKRTIKRDKTLIESLIDNSKEIIGLKNSLQFESVFIYAISKCKYSLISDNDPRTILKELRARITEIEMHNANMFKAAYSHQYKIIFDKLHFTAVDMAAGIFTVYVGDEKSRRKVVLFLSDVTAAFMDTIKEGELRDYNESMEKTIFPHCKPVWKATSLQDLYLEHLKQVIK